MAEHSWRDEGREYKVNEEKAFQRQRKHGKTPWLAFGRLRRDDTKRKTEVCDPWWMRVLNREILRLSQCADELWFRTEAHVKLTRVLVPPLLRALHDEAAFGIDEVRDLLIKAGVIAAENKLTELGKHVMDGERNENSHRKATQLARAEEISNENVELRKVVTALTAALLRTGKDGDGAGGDVLFETERCAGLMRRLAGHCADASVMAADQQVRDYFFGGQAELRRAIGFLESGAPLGDVPSETEHLERLLFEWKLTPVTRFVDELAQTLGMTLDEAAPVGAQILEWLREHGFTKPQEPR